MIDDGWDKVDARDESGARDKVDARSAPDEWDEVDVPDGDGSGVRYHAGIRDILGSLYSSDERDKVDTGDKSGPWDKAASPEDLDLGDKPGVQYHAGIRDILGSLYFSDERDKVDARDVSGARDKVDARSAPDGWDEVDVPDGDGSGVRYHAGIGDILGSLYSPDDWDKVDARDESGARDKVDARYTPDEWDEGDTADRSGGRDKVDNWDKADTRSDPGVSFDPDGVDVALDLIAGLESMMPSMPAARVGPSPIKKPKRHSGDLAPVGDVVGEVVARQGWQGRVSLNLLKARWSELAGDTNAQHSEPVGLKDKVVFVQADSSTWASALRLIAAQLVAKINQALGAGSVTRIEVRGPDSPSWKHGKRAVRDGRGPRDTYG